MNQTDIVNAATQAARTSKNIVSRQIDSRTTDLGTALTQTARDLEHVGENLRANGTIASAAQLADWAAGYVDRAATYLSTGNTDRFIADLESLGRQRPWAVAASAAALGFVAARVVKSSSVRRFYSAGSEGNYGGNYGYPADAASNAARSTPAGL